MDQSDDIMREQLVAAMPNLRAFAVSVCGDVHLANDLMQETLVKAWAHRTAFRPGTNLKAWLFTIFRNSYYSELRRKRREVRDVDGKFAAQLACAPEQHGRVEIREFGKALEQLSADQREALILVGAEGFSYEEAAEICGCAVGTVKSRVNRARGRLAELLDVEQQPGQERKSVITESGKTTKRAVVD